MNKQKVFWEGTLYNTAKAVIFCTPIVLANQQQIDFGVEFFPIGTFITVVGVILTGVITAYSWRDLGYSTIQILFKASLLDWVGTLIFMFLAFGGDGIAMFVYFSFFVFWTFPILIGIGILVGRAMTSNK